MTAARGFVTAGTWCADHNKVVPHWPDEDVVVEILSEEIRAGGSAANFAIDMRRLDPTMPVATIGLVGQDEDGAILLAEAEAAGIDTSRLIRKPGVRTNATDAFTSLHSGRRTHLFHPAVARELSPDHFTFKDNEARYLHLGLPGIHEKLDNPWQEDANGWVTVLRKARAAGMRTNLELCSIPAERINTIVRPCLPHLDLLLVNDFEIMAIDGMKGQPGSEPDSDELIAAAKRVLAAGAMELVVVHFPMAAVAVARDGTVWRQPSVAIPEVEIQGPNGAGDAFTAGFLYALHEDWPIDDALRLAHASAATALRGFGTTDTVETWKSCLDRAAFWGQRRE
ncbi:MAG: carbohydrate kinase family protein [Proteobacteria bacterium]|nr:carbohydrate kinase family protein [Pseudomonadota bacterium]